MRGRLDTASVRRTTLCINPEGLWWNSTPGQYARPDTALKGARTRHSGVYNLFIVHPAPTVSLAIIFQKSIGVRTEDSFIGKWRNCFLKSQVDFTGDVIALELLHSPHPDWPQNINPYQGIINFISGYRSNGRITHEFRFTIRKQDQGAQVHYRPLGWTGKSAARVIPTQRCRA